MLTYNVTDRLSLVSLVPSIVFFFFFVLSKSMHFAKYCFYDSTKINKKNVVWAKIQKYVHHDAFKDQKNINKCYCPNPSTTTIADEYQVNGCQSFDNWHYTSSSFSFMYTTCNNY